LAAVRSVGARRLRADETPRSVLRRGAELAVLTGFAIAQPVFGVVTGTPEFFVVRGASSATVVVFGLVVTLAPPAALLALEQLVDRLGGYGQRLHLVFVGVLSALVAGHALVRVADDTIPPWPLVAVALALGVAAVTLYRRLPAMRLYLAFLAPAPLVFLGLFLWESPLAEPELPAAASARDAVPIVMVVFDEFPTSSLLGRDRRIDGVRFPHFAAFAEDALWFRNATTVHDSTLTAVPALVSGRAGRGVARAVTSREHPENLFTLLRGSYRVVATESYTKLCPRSVCADDPRAASLPDLMVTAGLIAVQASSPSELRRRLPPVENIGAAGEPIPSFQAFLDRIRRTREPTLFFLHVLLPHNPWHTFPSGVQYAAPEGGVPFPFGFSDPPRWGGNDWLVEQAWQRHLLQTGFVDRLLGELVARLRATGLYDRALVVVTADHGASFHAGKPFRLTTREDVSDIAGVPLFVKPPGTGAGRTLDAYVRTTDILPTVLDIVGLDVPDSLDGRSLVAATVPDRRTVDVLNFEDDRVVVDRAAFERDRLDTLAERIRLFGAEESWERVFRVGPHPELVGRNAAELRETDAVGTAIELTQADAVEEVDPDSGSVPAYLSGRVIGDSDLPNLALAVNGRVAAVVPLQGRAFSALVSERAFRPGKNAVEAFLVP
jgi:Sulfatase